MFQLYFLLMAGRPPAEGSEGAGGMSMFMVLILIVGIWYFLLLRPQKKRQIKLQDLINNLKKGDEVITSGGVYGTVSSVSDKTIELKIADKIIITVLRSAVIGFQKEAQEEKK